MANAQKMVVHIPQESVSGDHPGARYINVSARSLNTKSVKAVLATVAGVERVARAVSGDVIVWILPNFDPFMVARDIRDNADALVARIEAMGSTTAPAAAPRSIRAHDELAW